MLTPQLRRAHVRNSDDAGRAFTRGHCGNARRRLGAAVAAAVAYFAFDLLYTHTQTHIGLAERSQRKVSQVNVPS